MSKQTSTLQRVLGFCYALLIITVLAAVWFYGMPRLRRLGLAELDLVFFTVLSAFLLTMAEKLWQKCTAGRPAS